MAIAFDCYQTLHLFKAWLVHQCCVASVSATRRLGQLSLGGSLTFAQGWFDNSRQSVYDARLRAAYTFEQEESHYIRPYLDFDLIYSESPGFNESGAGELALRKGSSS